MNNNPWHRFPDQPPFVLPEDRDMVLAFNVKQIQRAHQHYVLHLDLIPEPFVGNPNAPFVLLGNNPGVKSLETAAYKRKPTFVGRMRRNLLHQLSDSFPFLYLDPDPDISPPGKAWWMRKLRHLLSEVGGTDVAGAVLARHILAVEFFPYVSHRYGHGKLRLPSQEYSFNLVRNAIQRGAVIVLTRGERRWLRAVPELDGYQHLVRLKDVQRAPISRGNCQGDGYERIVRKINEMMA